MRTRLRSLLASLQPAEVVLRKAGDGHDDEGALSGTTLKVCVHAELQTPDHDHLSWCK